MTKALFWDFDGTLSHPNKSFFTGLPWAFSEKGYLWNEEDGAFLRTFYSWNTPQIDYADKTNDLWWDMQFDKIRGFCAGKQISKADTDRICELFREKLIDVANYQVYEDTHATLKTCVELGFRNYLITNNYPEIIENLKKLQLSQYFSDYIVSSHIGFEKPRAEFFAYAKKLSGNPTKAYVIGDNPIADIKGGQDAGFTAIAVHACKNSTADYYCEHLKQILPILKA